MAYVPVPKDLTKVKTKVMFNLTRRQLVCFTAGALVGVPLFLWLREPAGNSMAAMCMMLVMMPFFLLLLLAELLLPEVQAANWGKKCILALLAVFCIFSLRVDNATYEKGALMQDRIQQYFTVMIAQIRSTPGYTASTPVAYVGDPDAFGDTTFHQITGFAELPIAPLRYDSTPFSIGNTWEKFLDLRCGFAPPKADPEDYADLPEVQAMPCYPDYGSIQLINGTVVVKLKN